MSLDFTHIIYEHCCRENNKVAHELARVVKFNPPGVWLDTAPGEVIPLIVSDATIVAN